MENVDIQIVEYNSDLQKESIKLRYKVLREPLGLVFTSTQLAEEKDEIHIVGLQGKKVVAILLLRKMSNQLLKMRQVAVDAALQQSGIGRQLVAFSECYARYNSFTVIELHARDIAKEFYLQLRYKVVGDMFMEVGIPHYKMEKRLL